MSWRDPFCNHFCSATLREGFANVTRRRKKEKEREQRGWDCAIIQLSLNRGWLARACICTLSARVDREKQCRGHPGIPRKENTALIIFRLISQACVFAQKCRFRGYFTLCVFYGFEFRDYTCGTWIFHIYGRVDQHWRSMCSNFQRFYFSRLRFLKCILSLLLDFTKAYISQINFNSNDMN